SLFADDVLGLVRGDRQREVGRTRGRRLLRAEDADERQGRLKHEELLQSSRVDYFFRSVTVTFLITTSCSGRSSWWVPQQVFWPGVRTTRPHFLQGLWSVLARSTDLTASSPEINWPNTV